MLDTRLNGEYHIGRVEGPWEYRNTRENRDADVVNVRACQWVPVGTADAVPGKVLNSFRASRTLQAVDDDTVRFYSKLAFNSAGGEPRYDLLGENRELNLFALISPEDCEDIVGILSLSKTSSTPGQYAKLRAEDKVFGKDRLHCLTSLGFRRAKLRKWHQQFLT